jgi:serine protease Do
MFDQDNRIKRLIATFLFAAVCIGGGFLLATGWDMPSRVGAAPALVGNNATVGSGDQTVPVLDNQGHSPFVRVAEVVKPVVVNINSEKKISGHPPVPFDMFDWGPFFGQPPQGRGGRQQMPHVTAGGSGIIISKDGLILTNNHVVSDADDITVKFNDKTEKQAKLIGADPETDVALIKVDETFPPDMVAKLGDSDSVRIGDWAIAVGNPFGLDWTVTVGVISARGRSNLRISGDEGPSYQDFIQTDASINFGNSGGPLVNINGEVVGVNTAINAQGQGIGFAIPINLAHKIMQQLVAGGQVKRGYLGVVPGELDEVKREALGLDDKLKGVFVDSIQEGTPADKGGLKGADVIVTMDGKPVADVSDFRFRVADHPPDSELKMGILREGKQKDLAFKLGDRKDFVNAANAPNMKGEDIWLGIQVAPTDGRQGKKLGIEESKGALVIGVEPGSPAEGLIEVGDIIVEVGGMEIESVQDFHDAAEKLKDRTKAIPFWIFREGRRTFVPIRPAEK